MNLQCKPDSSKWRCFRFPAQCLENMIYEIHHWKAKCLLFMEVLKLSPLLFILCFRVVLEDLVVSMVVTDHCCCVLFTVSVCHLVWSNILHSQTCSLHICITDQKCQCGVLLFLCWGESQVGQTILLVCLLNSRSITSPTKMFSSPRTVSGSLLGSCF